MFRHFLFLFLNAKRGSIPIVWHVSGATCKIKINKRMLVQVIKGWGHCGAIKINKIMSKNKKKSGAIKVQGKT